MDSQFRYHFWQKVSITPGCWQWMGAKNFRGRPVFNPKKCKELGISYLAYRVSWTLHFGEIPQGMLVCHKCDNPSCVNPDHLFLGTYKDNTLDMLKKSRGGKAKLSLREVKKIREDNRPRREIAKDYGVTLGMIYKIKSGRSWGHDNDI